MKLQSKSIVVGRKPGKKSDEFKTAVVAFFKENNPHLSAKEPFKVLEFSNTEKVRLRDLVNVSYYLEGNDLVVNNLTEVELTQEEHILTIKGKQVIG